MANKVNPNKKDKESKKKKKKSRIDFPVAEAKYRNDDGKIVSAVNAENLLVAVPKPIKDGDKIVYAGFNHRKHNPLKKSAFASMATYIRFQAYLNRLKAAVLIKSAEEKETKAARIEKFGDEATRKKVQKVARMREQLEALEKQLKEDNIDVSEI